MLCIYSIEKEQIHIVQGNNCKNSKSTKLYESCKSGWIPHRTWSDLKREECNLQGSRCTNNFCECQSTQALRLQRVWKWRHQMSRSRPEVVWTQGKCQQTTVLFNRTHIQDIWIKIKLEMIWPSGKQTWNLSKNLHNWFIGQNILVLHTKTT